MKSVLAASALVLAVAAVTGCGGIPGASCQFSKGQVAADVTGDAKAFLDSAMTLKNTSDSMKADWDAEIKALAIDLKVEPKEELVLAAVSVNVKELKAKAQCEVMFEAKIEANASASASGDAKAGTGGNSAAGNAAASGNFSATVNFDLKCKVDLKANVELKAKLDITVPTVKAHFPKLLAISARAKDLAAQVKDVGEKGDALVKGAGSLGLTALSEVKCAVSAMAAVHAQVDVQVSFSVKAEASAKGEAGGDAKAG
jgi:carbon monoxide dehydrogenase subunit G